MQNLKRKISNIKAKLLTNQQFLSIFSQNNRLEYQNRSFSKINKRDLRADVLSLLSSALRPRLLGCILMFLIAICCIPISAIAIGEPSGGKESESIKDVDGSGGSSSTESPNGDSIDGGSSASITLTIPSSPLSLDLNPTVNNGFTTTSSSFNVKTDNSSGYTVSIKSKNESGDNSLVNGNNKLVSISSAISENAFKNGSEYINMWEWLPSKLNSEDNNNYQIAPGIEEVVLDNTKEANETGTDYNISLAAKVANDTPTGKYENTFIVSAVSNELPPDGIIQNWDGCNNLSEEQTVRLLDIRDNNVYTVAKLKDGKCWMTQNLRIGSNDTQTELNSDTSDIESNFTLPAGTTKIGSSSDTSGWYSQQYDTAHIYINDNSEYGGLYTWSAAMAGNGKDSSSSNYSICPKGWKIPSMSESSSLVSQYASNDAYKNNPPNLGMDAWAGLCDESGCPRDQGIAGFWWTSDGGTSVSAYYFQANDLDSDPYNGNRGNGYSVRCVQRGVGNITDLQYMQDWSELSSNEKTLVINSMEEGKQYTLIDKRDSNSYTIAKLKDGKVWMTQNLRIINKTISSEDSDMTSGNYTIPNDQPSAFRTTYDNDTSNHAYYGNNTNYGAHYTWYSATAGSGNSSLVSNAIAPNSICPKGWRLPIGGSYGGEFQSLTSAYGITSTSAGVNSLLGAPFNFSYTGYISYSSGTLSSQGSYGYYWSSTKQYSHQARSLYLSNSSFRLNDYSYSSDGRSVRCVARNDDYIMINYVDESNQSQDLPDLQNISPSENSVTLSNVKPTDSCNVNDFIGWCTVQPIFGERYVDDSCPGQTYQPGQSMPLSNEEPQHYITLHAMWTNDYGICSV